MMNAYISGTGYYVPPKVVTNQDLTQWYETSDEWITERSGIKERTLGRKWRRAVGFGSSCLEHGIGRCEINQG